MKNEASILGANNFIEKEIVIGDYHAFFVKGDTRYLSRFFCLDRFSITFSFIERAGSSSLIKYYVPDGITKIEVYEECNTVATKSWGLSRISQKSGVSDTYSYHHDGEGVNAYIIDTGIYTEHQDFEGRATWGATFTGDNNNKDCNGHGTHVSGIVGGKVFGVAKKVNLIAVKVLNCNGGGTFSGIIEGIEWVATQHKAKGKPSVANMSLGGSRNQALDDAVTAMVKQGVSTSVSAGNSNIDSCNHSVRSDLAINTGATDIEDVRSIFSNYGKCVDVFAPGTNIPSTYIGGPTDTRVLSGTSMASPHSCGAAAQILSAHNDFTPEQVKKQLITDATRDALDMNCGANAVCQESPNKLLFVGCH